MVADGTCAFIAPDAKAVGSGKLYRLGCKDFDLHDRAILDRSLQDNWLRSNWR